MPLFMRINVVDESSTEQAGARKYALPPTTSVGSCRAICFDFEFEMKCSGVSPTNEDK